MNEVERILNELQDIENILISHAGPSDLDAFRNNSSKAMLLASASYFERRIRETILEVCRSQSVSNAIVEFVDRQALERKFHSLFDWDKNNANKFFSLFGSQFSVWIKEKINNDEERKKQIQAFLDVGNKRNELVHNNYANFPLEYTYVEIWEKFQAARQFVDWLPSQFEEFDNTAGKDDN